MPIIDIFVLYFLIFIGFILTRKKLLEVKTLANLLFYILAPALVFRTFVNRSINLQSLQLGLIYFLISVGIYYLFQQKYKSHISAFMAGSTNSGYFGIPFAISVFGESVEGLAITCAVAYLIFEGILGYKSKKLKNLLKIPLLQALLIGLIILLTGLAKPIANLQIYQTLESLIYPGFTLLGMFLIGGALTQSQEIWPIQKLDLKFLIARQAVWLGLVFLLILIFQTTPLAFTRLEEEVLTLMALTPIAGNSVLVAHKTGQNLDKTAKIVFWSSVFSAIILSLYTVFI